ncbi:hypothetical protein [Paraburkholderia solisilvae]|uniref:Uncharacterized protein n=1 Tax=Paraburkholderia solisilvae TaxID=624376 RepID=A0A6J5DMV2_9BURK|nr:hypothetical protein [Paraburkholderia solisilvae]CAB3754532.1 hypothetical protein LMG29739_01951 [Paraburkholderia solisilvae]
MRDMATCFLEANSPACQIIERMFEMVLAFGPISPDEGPACLAGAGYLLLAGAFRVLTGETPYCGLEADSSVVCDPEQTARFAVGAVRCVADTQCRALASIAPPAAGLNAASAAVNAATVAWPPKLGSG